MLHFEAAVLFRIQRMAVRQHCQLIRQKQVVEFWPQLAQRTRLGLHSLYRQRPRQIRARPLRSSAGEKREQYGYQDKSFGRLQLAPRGLR